VYLYCLLFAERVFFPPLPASDTLLMVLVDFYQQSRLFNRPHNPNPPSDFLTGPATRPVYDGVPSDDLGQDGVFVDIEDFVESVLHVPADWRARWGPVIRAVERNPGFTKHYFNTASAKKSNTPSLKKTTSRCCV